jgi:hypothetical protein
MIGVDDTAVVADSVVNLFAAAGLLLVARANRRLDPRGALTRRIAFALSFTAAFFFVRAAAWLSGAIMLDRLTTVLAGAVPLAGLLVAEGVLRRHAPLWLKIAGAAGCGLPGLALVLRLSDAAVNLANLCVVFAGFGAVAWLLVTRDPADLTAAENRLIRRLVAVLIVLLPLIATDFRSIFPAIPVRLGAVGALVILYVGFGAGGLTTLARTRVFAMLAFLVIAGCFALAFGMIRSGGADVAELVRVEAVGFSGLLLAGLLSEELGAQGERAHPPGPLLLADDPERFAAALATHPLLADAHILAGDALADVAGADFAALLARHPVLRRRETPWDRDPHDGGVERALSLIESHDATHLVRLSLDPPRVMLLALPAIANDPRAESEIALAQRVGELVFSRDMPTRSRSAN